MEWKEPFDARVVIEDGLSKNIKSCWTARWIGVYVMSVNKDIDSQQYKQTLNVAKCIFLH